MSYPSDNELPWRPPAERDVPEMDHEAGWKESAYHPRIGEVICARLEAGETVRQVAADPRMPSYCTIFQWRKMHPEFDDAYRAMRARLALAKVEAGDVARRSKVYWRIHKARVDGKRPRDWVSGRKSTYTNRWGRAYCERIAGGEAGYRISADPDMPSARCVYRWLKTIPEFRAMYVEAREIQQIGLACRIDDAVIELPDRVGLAAAKREVARLEGRMGRLEPKVWKALPPERVWPEPPGGGMRKVKGARRPVSAR